MKLGELIAIARECKGWTLRDMERETGISATGISIERAASTVMDLKSFMGILRAPVVGRVTGEVREGDQVPGMPHAICHACGLGRACDDPDCPHAQSPQEGERGRQDD